MIVIHFKVFFFSFSSCFLYTLKNIFKITMRLFVILFLIFVSLPATFLLSTTEKAYSQNLHMDTSEIYALSKSNFSPLKNVIQVASGYRHTCALLRDGTVKCWGNNDYGQLGNGSKIESNIPVSVSGIDAAVQITTGDDHTCALLESGKVKCWGLNHYGQLGFGSSESQSLPIHVFDLKNATSLSAGNDYTCALLKDGTVKCWGYNKEGQLGNGSQNTSYFPIVVSGIEKASSLTTGNNHACVVLGSGKIKCWGDNEQGQLGNNSTDPSSFPTEVSGVSTAISASAGYNHTCAVLQNGHLKCWGRNVEGQLGNSSSGISSTPVDVSDISNAIFVSSGRLTTCAVLNDKSLKCWGSNSSGQIGIDTIHDGRAPSIISGIDSVISVSNGSEHICVVLEDGGVACWGNARNGRLGNGFETVAESATPVPVVGINSAISVTSGYQHSCALLKNGTVQCWGENEYGQLGNYSSKNIGLPVSVPSINSAISVSAGERQTCATLQDGSVKCWGNKGHRYLENGIWRQSFDPETIRGIETATSVSCGSRHCCTTLEDGKIHCWGDDSYGQLGNGPRSIKPKPFYVMGIDSAKSVSAGGSQTCATLMSGYVKCWGQNYNGQLGDDFPDEIETPVVVLGLSSAESVSTNGVNTCVVLQDKLECWGRDYGNGSKNKGGRSSISGINGVVELTEGGGHTCVILDDGSVKCWGDNVYGELGDGNTLVFNKKPVVATGIKTAVSISAGGDHTCVVLKNGSVMCWGSNSSGQIGNGYAGYYSVPIFVVDPDSHKEMSIPASVSEPPVSEAENEDAVNEETPGYHEEGAEEYPQEQKDRTKQLRKLKKEKRMSLVRAIVESKDSCASEHQNDYLAKRGCLRKSVKMYILESILKERENKKQCRAEGKTGDELLYCALKKMFGDILSEDTIETESAILLDETEDTNNFPEEETMATASDSTAGNDTEPLMVTGKNEATNEQNDAIEDQSEADEYAPPASEANENVDHQSVNEEKTNTRPPSDFKGLITGDEVEPGSEKKTNSRREFAQCVTKSGAVFYGVEWCPYCQKQKQLFGGSIHDINYVDCEKNRDICQDMKITNYPTWIFGHERITGVKPLHTIEKYSECLLGDWYWDNYDDYQIQW
jgi:alpha-tubulin suppressor-like RCC1 family protein/glutaredoxin